VSLHLVGKRRFGPFFATQFLGAFNDNLFKNALLILITFQAGSVAGMSTNTLVNLGQVLFILPFFLFSAAAGFMADRAEKSSLIRRIKALEIAIMLLAAAAFALDSVPLLLAVLFLMGTQSAFFGPVKYAILPQHLAEHELVGGNGVVEMGTFLAILLGTVVAGVLIALGAIGTTLVSALIVVLAVLGWLTSRAIPVAPALSDTPLVKPAFGMALVSILRDTKTNRTVFNAILGISWFWFYGLAFLTQLPNLTKLHLGGDETVVTLLLTLFSLGIGVGSLLCERMSGRLVEIGLVPFGAIGLTYFGFDLYLAIPEATQVVQRPLGEFLADSSQWRALFDLFAMAVFGGFYIVPLYALVQLRSPVDKRSRIIAGNNVLNALFMVVSALTAIVLLGAGLSIPQLFLVVALMTAAVSIYIFTLVPEFLMRFILWLLIHTVYRLRTNGVENVPERGAVLLACNHVSFVDALIIAAACRRPVRFVMDHRIFSIPIVNFVFRVGRAIPIAPKREDPAMMERAFDAIAEALEGGEVVCIFPEGKITHDGDMSPFKPGIERVVSRTPCAVVPIALRGLWGSFFSRKDGAAMSRPWRLVSGFWSRIELRCGAALETSDFALNTVEITVASLRGDAK
jgi:1-acyl-sn-glycerol-3-phosphate acyltransferase